jgi:hypothetical protein
MQYPVRSVVKEEVAMRQIIGFLILSFLFIGLSGCSYLFYPRASEYAAQARGATGVETLINLTMMMEDSANRAKGGKGLDGPLDDYHNQWHALRDSFCLLTKEQAKTAAYDSAVKQNKELKEIFWDLWTSKDTQPQRDQNLDRSIAKLKELRATLEQIG